MRKLSTAIAATILLAGLAASAQAQTWRGSAQLNGARSRGLPAAVAGAPGAPREGIGCADAGAAGAPPAERGLAALRVIPEAAAGRPRRFWKDRLRTEAEKSELLRYSLSSPLNASPGAQGRPWCTGTALLRRAGVKGTPGSAPF